VIGIVMLLHNRNGQETGFSIRAELYLRSLKMKFQ
jgi:hypothetical protein